MNSCATLARRLAATVLTATLLVGYAPVAAQAVVAPPAVSAPSALLMTMTGEPAWSRNADSRRHVASTIKLLNALVVRERVRNLDEIVVVPRKAVISDGGVGLVAGQKLTVRQLLRMMLVASANDAAEAIAIHVGGTEARYVALMNAKAAQLHLTGTHAVDPHGLSKRETSTARDLSVLARKVMADWLLRGIVGMHSVIVPRVHGGSSTVPSTNHLYGHYSGIEGVKTGYTNPAGFCFIGAAKRGSVELLGVVLGAKSLAARFGEMRKLLDWGFAHVHSRKLVSRDATAGVAPVAGGVVATVSVHPEEDASMTLFDGGGPTTTSVSFDAGVKAPVARGQRLGTIIVSSKGVELVKVPLLADAAVASRPQAGAVWQQVLLTAFALH